MVGALQLTCHPYTLDSGALIYMSTRGWIGELVRHGRLVSMEPVFSGDPIARQMFLSPEVSALIEGPWPSAKAEKRCGHLRADLESFVLGREVGVCNRPFEARTATMGLLSPVTNGVWDIRSQEPRPGIRVLGFFAERDVFVALVPASRSIVTDFIPRGPLGDRDSREWRSIIREARLQWKALFPNHNPIGGSDIDEYLSGKYHIVGD